jgi:TRAP-type C4-dicarboxylate transport system substrate-binding protein
MKKTNLLVLFMLLVSGALLLFGCNSAETPATQQQDTSKVSASNQETIELKYVDPTNPPTAKILQMNGEIFDKIEQMTEGRVKVKIYPSASLLGPTEVVDGIQKGIADLGYITGGWYSMKNLPLLLTDTQLFVWEDKSGAYRATTFENTMNELFTSYLNDMGYDDVEVLETGYGGSHQWAFKGGTDRLEPKTPEDFQGLKIRTAGAMGDLLRDYFGIETVVMPPTEIYEALERGIIDGTMCNSNLSNWLDMGWADAAKYCIKMDWHPICMNYLVNRTSLEKLTPNDQEIVRNAMSWIVRLFSLNSMAEDIQCQTYLAQNGVKIHVPTDEEMALWNDQSVINAYLSDWQDAVGAEYVKPMMQVVQKYNENAPVDWSIFGLE